MSRSFLDNASVRHYLAVIVVGCSLGGVLLATGLVLEYRGIEREQREAGEGSLALRDLAHLEIQLSQWLVSIDLLLGHGNSYLWDGAEEQAGTVLASIDAIATARIDPQTAAGLGAGRDQVGRILEIAGEVALASGTEGQGRPHRRSRRPLGGPRHVDRSRRPLAARAPLGARDPGREPAGPLPGDRDRDDRRVRRARDRALELGHRAGRRPAARPDATPRKRRATSTSRATACRTRYGA